MADKPIVLLVPGIGGSGLSTRDLITGLPQFKVWPDGYALKYLERWRQMELAEDGTSPGGTKGVDLVPGPPIRDFYGVFIDEANSQGYDVQWALGDFRKSIADDARRLQEIITAGFGGRPKRIVAHSRGGLVTKLALENMEAAGRDLSIVQRVISCGTPFTGAMAMIAFMAGWLDYAKQAIELLATGSPFLYGPFKRKNTDVGEVLRVLDTFPSIYELLPSPKNVHIDQRHIDGIYDVRNWALSGVPVLDKWLAAAKARWNSVDRGPPAVSWKAVQGIGIPTLNSVNDFTDLTNPASMTLEGTGDGVVERNSLDSVGNITIIETKLRHDEYFTKREGRLLISSLLVI